MNLTSNNLTTFTDQTSGLVTIGQKGLEGNTIVSKNVDASSTDINP